MNRRLFTFIAASYFTCFSFPSLLAAEAPSVFPPRVDLGTPAMIATIGELMGTDSAKAIASIPGTGKEIMNVPGGIRELVYEFDSLHSIMRLDSMGGRVSCVAWTIQFTDLAAAANLYNGIRAELGKRNYQVAQAATKAGRTLVAGDFDRMISDPEMVVIGAQFRPRPRSIVFDVSLDILVGDAAGLPNIQVTVDVLPDLGD